MSLPPPPDSRDLLPPLLACLPTAFVSPRPPPALLPLLSPLLRQRATFLAADTSSRNDGWLPLLSWDAERAARLPSVVERMHLEPHPVSGEIELDDTRPAKYRRLDEETLHARLEVEQFELLPIFVWCESDEHGGTGPGWKLAELRSLADLDDETEWYDSIPEATEAASSRAIPEIRQNGISNGHAAHNTSNNAEDDDDDYWASYDRTPGRTPAQKHSPAPPAMSSNGPSNRQRTQSELDYYARYGSEVQPAMDAHDPDEDHPEIGQSTINGDSLVQNQSAEQQQQTQPGRISRPNGASMFPADPISPSQDLAADVEAPRPISPTSSNGSSIERLESKAAEMSEALSLGGGLSRGSDRAQMAVKQHISTDIKSLFRLAKSSGMERREFERIVRTELDCLSLLEQDE